MKVLDKALSNTIRMWKWITNNLPEGFSEATDEIKDFIINRLKKDWLKANGFKGRIIQDCFLCDYDQKHKGYCKSCPAFLAHPERPFDCTDSGYNYAHNPILFYEELLDRNARRKGESNV